MLRNSIQKFYMALFVGAVAAACTTGGANEDSNAANCDALAQLHTQPFTPVTLGEAINLSVDHLDGADYYWVGPNGFDSHAEDAQVAFAAEYKHRGWYYVNIFGDDNCPVRTDSVYVKVNFPQGTPPCSLVNNRATFSGPVTLPTQNFYFMTWGLDPVSGRYQVVANGTNGDMTLYLSSYWATHDFEDGIYNTTNTPSIDYNEYDKVFISDVNSSNYWACEVNKPVYISHVGGKIRVSFCNIRFSAVGSGTLAGYTTQVSAQLTQP